MRSQIVFAALVINSACLVDLDRREGTLRLSAVSDDPSARGIQVRVSEGPDVEPYEGTHPSNAVPFSVQVPDLSVLPGEVDVEAQLVDEMGLPLGQAGFRRLGVSRDETTVWVFDFSEASSSTSAPEGESPPLPTPGASPTELRVSLRPSSAEVVDGAVVLSVAGTPLETALEPLERQLLGPPTSLELHALTVEVVDINEDDPSQTTPGELNEVFPDTVTIKLRGAGVSNPLARLVSSEAASIDLDLTPSVSVLEWVGQPSSAGIELSGVAFEGVGSLGVELRVRAQLRGAN